ncbi:hypothetical protein G9A89_009318 [Geosiphon pyriformis]|nr:hypothetical protein G9A89_009318 [Geosiphon pyriformis]
MTLDHSRPRITQNWRSAMVVYQLIPSSSNSSSGLRSWNLSTGTTQNPNSQNYLSLLVTSEDTTNTNLGSNQQLTLTSNIPPATVIEDKSLAAIFPFEIEEPSRVPLFSRAAIKEKPIMVMYTNAKIDGHSIKLILDNQLGHQVDHAASTRIITANGATKTPIGKIDNLLIEINGITVPIKILIMEATQYQALVGNDWLSKINAMLNWNTQKLQLSQNSQYTACCGNNKEYQMATKFYCCACHIECFGRPKQVGKWDNTPCLACGETLLDKGMWNNIPERGGMCDIFCQYTILISDWVKKKTPIEAA